MERLQSTITIYDGISQSMGAVFSVCYGKDRVIMDFGSAFNPEIGNYVVRDDNWIKEKLDLGLLPRIEGLYPKKYLEGYDLKSFEECDYNTAVFVSHLHLDHMSNIGAVDERVPVYLSEKARELEYILEDIGEGVDSTGRGYYSFTGREYIEVGRIKVYPIVNSSCSYGMYGFLIETPDLKVGYTADLSLCYEQPENVQKEMEIFKERKLDVLLCDNCNFDDQSLMYFFNSTDADDIYGCENIPEGWLSFAQHYANIEKLYHQRDGLIVFNHYEREMFDVEKIYQWAEKTDREVVFEPKAGFIVTQYFNRKVNIYYNGGPVDERLKEFIQESNIITREDILNNPERYVLHNSYENIEELYRLKIKDSVYIHAEGNPFNAADKNRMKKTAMAAGYQFASYDDPHYYQHGYPAMIRYFVDEIDPMVVIGYHGKHPERIRNKSGESFVPELYKSYHMENGRLQED